MENSNIWIAFAILGVLVAFFFVAYYTMNKPKTSSVVVQAPQNLYIPQEMSWKVQPSTLASLQAPSHSTPTYIIDSSSYPIKPAPQLTGSIPVAIEAFEESKKLAKTPLINTSLASELLAAPAYTAPANTAPANTATAKTAPAKTAPANTGLANTPLAYTPLASELLAPVVNAAPANTALANTPFTDVFTVNRKDAVESTKINPDVAALLLQK